MLNEERELREKYSAELKQWMNKCHQLEERLSTQRTESKNLNDLLKFEATKNEKSKTIAESLNSQT